MAGSAHKSRAAASQHDEEADERDHNLSEWERWVSVAGGSAIAAYGLRRRDPIGVALAVLGGGALLHRGLSGRCLVYHTLGIDTSEAEEGHWLERKHGPAAVLDASHARKVERSVTINRAAADLYRYWRNFENLPHIMQHLQSVEVKSARRSRWIASGPAGSTVEWDAEIINEIPDQLIAWKSVDDAQVPNAGSVHFAPAPGGRGTVVRVVLEYEPPAGRLGAVVAKLLGEEPDAQVREDLRRFKQIMEAGEIATTRGQSSGREREAE